MSTESADTPDTRFYELDLRSLALLRVALGIFVFLTVLFLVGDMTAFLTDDGVLPRDRLVASSFRDIWPSFHMGTGSLHTQVLLNGLLAAFAVGLVLGWHTPLMVLGCWVLLNSLQARNPFLFDRGDLELSLVLFWGFFLPLGRRWSLDARAGRKPFGCSTGMAPAALVIQFAMIYLFAAYLKSGPFWLSRGDGLEHSLISPLFATNLSLWLAQSAKPLLPLLNYAVIAGEVFVALLLLCPISVGLTRSLAVALLILFHGSVGLLFDLGLFPWLGAALPLALVPQEVWDTGPGSRLASVLDSRFGGAVGQDRIGAGWARARSAFLAGCLAMALLSNLMSVPANRHRSLPAPLVTMIDGLRLSQHWELFSPIPPYYGRFVLTASWSGQSPKLVFEGPPTREATDLLNFPSHHWRMLMIASLYPELALIREGLVHQLMIRAGLKDWDGATIDYRFEAELPDDTGKLQKPVTWNLWSKQPNAPRDKRP